MFPRTITYSSGTGHEVTVLNLIPEGRYLSAGSHHIHTQTSQALRGYWRYIQANASGFASGHNVKKNKLDANYSGPIQEDMLSVNKDCHAVRDEPGRASEIHTALSAFSAGFHNFTIFCFSKHNVTRGPFVLVNLTDLLFLF
jgi:hypothetical protein